MRRLRLRAVFVGMLVLNAITAYLAFHYFWITQSIKCSPMP